MILIYLKYSVFEASFLLVVWEYKEEEVSYDYQLMMEDEERL